MRALFSMVQNGHLNPLIWMIPDGRTGRHASELWVWKMAGIKRTVKMPCKRGNHGRPKTITRTGYIGLRLGRQQALNTDDLRVRGTTYSRRR
ncbi:unnamed protein product [Cuscuta epithymum]|uniref:Uncharacterized protein n=1 Tax=Cuscuta epithymum TaxID=186058 RepID=A0AAV0ESN2_9ASTE|nr:unnamed protein product [Cuscuta epithymum]